VVAGAERRYPVSERQLLRLAAAKQSIADGMTLPDSGANILVNGFRIEGDLDEARLRTAVAHVVDRHDLLRAVFHGDRPPFEVSAAERSFGLEVRDGHDVAGIDAPFDLGAGQLARFWLVPVAHRVHELWVAIEHLAADGISFDLVLRDLAEAYNGLCDGREPTAVAVDVPGVSLGEHETALAESAAGQVSREYYDSALAGGTPWQPVLGTKVRAAAEMVLAERLQGCFTMDGPAVRRLVDHCATAGTSVLAAVVATVAAAMHDVVGVPALTTYCVLSNRSTALADTVGPIASVVPVRVDGAWTHPGSGRELIDDAVNRAVAGSTCSFYRYARENGAHVEYQDCPIAVVNVFPRSGPEEFRLSGVDVEEVPRPHVPPLKPGISFEVIYDSNGLSFSVTCPSGFISGQCMNDLVEHAKRELGRLGTEAVTTA
jgi:hypothetical protein